MEELVNRFVIDLKCHGYLEGTQVVYRKHLERFFKKIQKNPEEVTIEEIKDYQVYLLDERKLDPQTINLNLAAIRFFYLKTLRRPWRDNCIAFVKRRKKLPVILSPEEVAALINAAINLKHKTVLMAMYSFVTFEADRLNMNC